MENFNLLALTLYSHKRPDDVVINITIGDLLMISTLVISGGLKMGFRSSHRHTIRRQGGDRRVEKVLTSISTILKMEIYPS
jgi:hypothetical protein